MNRNHFPRKLRKTNFVTCDMTHLRRHHTV